MQPRFAIRPETKIVGVGGTFVSVLSPDKTNDVVIPKLWALYIPRSGEIKARANRSDVGASMPVPEAERTRPGECRYIAGTEVTTFEDVPAGMTTMVVPGGEYAVFTHKGRIDRIVDTMRFIYESWLPASGRKRRDAPDLEIYDDRFRMDSDASEMDICIPVA